MVTAIFVLLPLGPIFFCRLIGKLYVCVIFQVWSASVTQHTQFTTLEGSLGPVTGDLPAVPRAFTDTAKNISLPPIYIISHFLSSL